jgi:tight adherence protein B
MAINPTLILWVGGGIVLLLLIAGAVVTFSSERSLVEERIDTFMEAATELEFGSSEMEGAQDRPSALTELLNSLVSGTSFADRISAELGKADLKFKPGEYLALLIISIFLTALFGYFVFGQPAEGSMFTAYLFGLIGAIVGYFLPMIFIKRLQVTRLKKFGDQLPDMLNLMVNGLRAGFSTMQALEAISKEMPAPINGEFRRVVQEMQLGIPMEKALDNLLRRIPSEDLDLVITAVNVQREVGGNLAEILETISHTIRERIRIKGEIKAITAQVVYSGRFLSILPLILSAILWVVNRPYMEQFFQEPKICGIGMLVCGGIMIIVGYLVMNKIADIDI